MIREKFRFDGDTMSVQEEQDVSGVIGAVEKYREIAPRHFGEARYRFVGSVPSVIYNDIVRGLGPGAGQEEINKALMAFLRDGDHSKFVVRGA